MFSKKGFYYLIVTEVTRGPSGYKKDGDDDL